MTGYALLLAALLAEGGNEPAGGSAPAPSAFSAAPSQACRACHPRHYQEWVASVHAFAGRTPGPLEAAGPASRGLPDRNCAGCHGSLDRLLGRSFPPGHPIDLSHGAERAVSCTTCHQIVDEHARTGGEGLAGGRCLPPGLVRMSPDAPFHRTKPGQVVHRAETCGPCHEVASSRGVRVERTYSQYLASIYPDRSITCATCHMPPFAGLMVPDGPLRYRLHRHDAIGVDVAAEAVPEAGPQVERVLLFLRPAILVSLRAQEKVEAGRSLDLTVEIKNAGAGHNFPAGPAGERRMWLEVETLQEKSDGSRAILLHSSGRPGSDGDPEAGPDLVELSDRLVDAGGAQVEEPEEAARVEERSLRAMEVRRVEFHFPVPRDPRGGSSVRARVRLLFRAASMSRLRARGLAGLAGRYPVLELFSGEVGPVPVVEREFGPEVVRVPEDRAGIPEALAAAPAGGTVLVGPGLHLLESPLVFEGKGIKLLSREGPGRTVLRLKEPGPGAAGAPVAVFRDARERGGEGPADVISGFTLEGGRGLPAGEGRLGGGIHLSGVSARIENVVLRGNTAQPGDGGGIYALRSRVVIRESSIERNRATGKGGGLFASGSRVEVFSSRFAGNRASTGGGVAADSGSLSLSDVTVQGNWSERGGGLWIEGAEADLRGLKALGNVALTGGGILIAGAAPVRIERSVIAGNSAGERGGGLSLSKGARPSLLHVTMVQNSARVAGAGSGDRATGAEASIRNSIIWANRPPSISGRLEYSVTDDPRHQGGTNPQVLPLFEASEGEWVDCGEPTEDDCVPLAAAETGAEAGGSTGQTALKRFVPGDYRLVYGSPGVDAGDPRDGADPDGTRTDLGAIHRPQPPRAFVRGDVDGDGALALGDALRAAAHLFGGKPLGCAAAADLDDDGRVGPLDVLWLVARSFGLGPPPREPFPACGVDPTRDDGLGCFEAPANCR